MSPRLKETELWSKAGKWSVLLLGIALLASSRDCRRPESRGRPISGRAASVERLHRGLGSACISRCRSDYRHRLRIHPAERKRSDQHGHRTAARHWFGSDCRSRRLYRNQRPRLERSAKDRSFVPPTPAAEGAPASEETGQGKSYDARTVGITTEIDLAVIKIEAHGLPSLPIPKPTPPRQGEVVFAFGSPEGLRNTVTMGVVSSVARQPDPDSPLVYVQTDTPINPGNSGGPLVNADGQLVGINTFIFSTSGGNQGLGFAIPAGVVAFAYPQLLKYGHIHQPEIGAIIQTITPELAAALHLHRDFGVIVSDVLPGGPADSAGMRTQDIILSVGDESVGTLPLFTRSLYMHNGGERVKFRVLRGSDELQLDVALIDRPHKTDSLIDRVDPEKNLVRRLGILGVELDLDLAQSLPDLRIPTGIIVAGKTVGASEEIPVQTGDVIHGINGKTITTLADLRAALDKLKVGDAVALLVERYGQLIYVSFLL